MLQLLSLNYERILNWNID